MSGNIIPGGSIALDREAAIRMPSKRPLKRFLGLTVALSGGVVAGLSCASSAQLREFVFREVATVVADFVADTAVDASRGRPWAFPN